MGRPTIRTKDIDDTILAGRRLGFGWPTIADAVGCSHKTMQRWLREDLDFCAACKMAFARAKYSFANKLMHLAMDKGNVSALIFWLKTRCPEFWQGVGPSRGAEESGPGTLGDAVSRSTPPTTIEGDKPDTPETIDPTDAAPA